MLKRITLLLAAAWGLGNTPLPANAVTTEKPAYKIVSQDGAAETLRVSVRLDARQSSADLKAIADDVRIRLPANKAVSTVAYYLPAMALTSKAWAEVKLGTSDPVSIFGLRLDEEQAFRAQAGSDRRNRIGVWLTSPPALAGRLTLYRERSKIFAEWQLRNGQTTTDEVTEQRSGGGRRFNITGGDGGYYRLDANGALELGNGTAVIAVAEPLRPEPVNVSALLKAAPKAGLALPPVAGPAAAPILVQAETLKAGHVATKQPPARRRGHVGHQRSPVHPTRQAEAADDDIRRALAR